MLVAGAAAQPLHHLRSNRSAEAGTQRRGQLPGARLFACLRLLRGGFNGLQVDDRGPDLRCGGSAAARRAWLGSERNGAAAPPAVPRAAASAVWRAVVRDRQQRVLTALPRVNGVPHTAAGGVAVLAQPCGELADADELVRVTRDRRCRRVRAALPDSAFIVEVQTDQPSRESFGRIRAWKALEQRIAKIPIGVVLALKGNGRVAPRPPDAGMAKRIAREVRAHLLSSPGTALVRAGGYTFAVLADRFGYPIPSPNGLYAQFAAPSGVAGPVDARRLAQAVDDKVRRYSPLANRHAIPLIVAVGAHRFTSVDLSDVDDLLAGAPTIGFHFNVGDTYIGEKAVNIAHPPQWTMLADLAGLL